MDPEAQGRSNSSINVFGSILNDNLSFEGALLTQENKSSCEQYQVNEYFKHRFKAIRLICVSIGSYARFFEKFTVELFIFNCI